MSERVRLAITMGDPTGVGPETIVGAWASDQVHAAAAPVVFGHPDVMRRAVLMLGRPIEVVEIARLADAMPSPGVLPCLSCCGDDAAAALPCRVDARGGQAAYDALVAAADAAHARQVDAIVTAPLNKAALSLAGHDYPGHTELLAHRCGVGEVAMMLYLGPGALPRRERGLGVVHVTLHTALRNVFAAITPEAILSKARLIDAVMTKLNGVRPKIGVAALNPHAGEDGLFGDEEQRIIVPAVRQGIAEGLPLTGPIPADTLMLRAAEGEFDAVVAMYHDQGHIAIKLLGMHHAVNITLGLPIVRTSVAHGTAFDLAWQGRADTRGMVEAIDVASRLAVL